jgi:hypothetical protein
VSISHFFIEIFTAFEGGVPGLGCIVSTPSAGVPDMVSVGATKDGLTKHWVFLFQELAPLNIDGRG